MLVDIELLPLIKLISICVTKSGSNKNAKFYCQTSINNSDIKIHKLITGFNMTDHINRNTLDNRFINLRWTNDKENIKNKAILPIIHGQTETGLKYCKISGNIIGIDIKRHFYYKTEEEKIIADEHATIFRKTFFHIDHNTSSLEFTGREDISDLEILKKYIKFNYDALKNNITYDPKKYFSKIDDITDTYKKNSEKKYMILIKI